MNLELKNIKFSEWASEETNCYQASLYCDGKPLAIVSNEGKGGADNQYRHSAFKKENFRKSFFDMLTEIDDYFKGQPKKKYNDFELNFELNMDLELWCSEQVERHLQAKDLKRKLKKGSVIKQFKKVIFWKHHLDTEFLKMHYPKAIILNDLPFEKALDNFMGDL